MKNTCKVLSIILVLACALQLQASPDREKDLKDILSRMAPYQIGDPASWRSDLLGFTRQLPESQKDCTVIAGLLIDFMRSDATLVAKRELVPLLQAVVTEKEKPELLEMARDASTGVLAMDVLVGARLLADGDWAQPASEALSVDILKKDNPAEALLAAIKNAEPGQRANFIRLMYKLPDPAGMGARILTLDDLSTKEVEHVLRVSSQIGDSSVLGRLRQWQSNPPSISCLRAAVECLAHVGNADDVSAMLDLAADTSSPVAKDALVTLECMRGPDVDDALASSLRTLAPDQQIIAMEVLAARCSSEAADVLLDMALHSEAQLQAIKSLSLVAEIELLDDLVDLRRKCSNRDEFRAVDQAFYRLLVRQPDPQKYLSKLQGIVTEIPADASPESLKAIIKRLEAGQ
ncbi:MAG: HEAT repeat domain-containing protein [Puniceicoccaceae bacterium]